MIVHKCESSGGTNTPFGLLIEPNGALSFNRSNASGSRPFRVWASSSTLTPNQLAVIAATQGADMSIAPKFFIDGAFDSGAASNLYDGTGAGAPTPTPVSLKLGNRTDNLSRFNGEIYDVLVLKRALSASEIADLSRNIWAVWQSAIDGYGLLPRRPITLPGQILSRAMSSASGISSGCKRSPPWHRHRRI